MILCSLSDLETSGAKGPIKAVLNGQEQAVFVVRQGEQVRAYVNSCPHVGVPLEMEPDHYLDLTGDHIVCTVHAAWFDVRGGECVAGPCLGEFLTPVPIRIQDGMVLTL